MENKYYKITHGQTTHYFCELPYFNQTIVLTDFGNGNYSNYIEESLINVKELYKPVELLESNEDEYLKVLNKKRQSNARI